MVHVMPYLPAIAVSHALYFNRFDREAQNPNRHSFQVMSVTRLKLLLPSAATSQYPVLFSLTGLQAALQISDYSRWKLQSEVSQKLHV